MCILCSVRLYRRHTTLATLYCYYILPLLLFTVVLLCANLAMAPVKAVSCTAARIYIRQPTEKGSFVQRDTPNESIYPNCTTYRRALCIAGCLTLSYGKCWFITCIVFSAVCLPSAYITQQPIHRCASVLCLSVSLSVSLSLPLVSISSVTLSVLSSSFFKLQHYYSVFAMAPNSLNCVYTIRRKNGGAKGGAERASPRNEK